MSKGKTPQIRFKGYTDDWEQRKLGEVIADLYNGQTPSRFKEEYWNGDISWLSSGELNRGHVNHSVEKITKAGQESAHLRLIPRETFVMAITGLEAPGTRGNCAILDIETTLNQSCMALFPKKNMLTSEFLFQWYRKVGEDYGIRFTQGTKQQSYNAEIIKDLDICLPKVDEQKKISDCLDNIDNLITLHQRELDSYKKFKNGMLQKMFPKNGETVPEIRFPGFTDPWEQRKLGELGKARSGIGFPDVEQGGKEGVPFYKVSDMNNVGNEHEMVAANNHVTKEQIARKGWKPIDEVPAIFFAKVGAAVLLNRKRLCRFPFLLDNNTMAYSIDGSALDADFAITLFETIDLTSLVQVGALPSYNSGDVENIDVIIPKMSEQRKIGAYFKRIDSLITLHQRKLDAVKNFKKSMLQKMFV